MKIAHVADLQVKNRDKNLYLSYFNNLKDIVTKTEENKFDAIVIAGDLFEFATPNESERKLIYNFIVDLVKISTLKEIVIISGNHDLEKYKKKQQKIDAFESDVNNNLPVLGVFTDMIKSINQEFDNKIIYLKDSKVYDSKLPNVKYIGYSLEDGCNPDISQVDDKNINICVYHGMIKEYVDSVKLPIKNSVYESLDSLEVFPQNSIVMAGDIHQQLKYEGLNGCTFYYSGSTQQHTHNEGYFFKTQKIDDKVSLNKQEAETKAIFCYDFVDKEYNIEKIQLKDFVKYFTIELTEDCSYTEVFDSLRELFEHLSNDSCFGETQNYIKIKSLTKFVKEEHKLFDLINEYSKNNNFNISFEYEKISSGSNIVTNETVKEVVKDVVKSITDEESSDIDEITLSKENIDKLILKNDDVVKLFENVLDSQLDGAKIEDVDRNTIKNDTMALFRKELDSRNNEKRYDVLFKNIKCNSFMGLGQNDINLDIPGIVRILGTNGIGKTTLFKMVRWVISGELLEGMKSNTVVKNNLLVFNKNLPEIDDVEVTLNIEVKNTPVRVIRTLHRSWKNNTTKDEKYSKDWKDYVSGVDRNIKIIINPDTEKQKVLVGENAELNIKLWFGETINNIMFLNQSKIESFVRSEPEKLNKMVLNYIGVDYIQKLEDNLDEVKESLMSEVVKPKLSKDDIQISITDAGILVKKSKEKLEELKQNDLDSYNKESSKIETTINDLNKKLLDIGNIPELLQKNEQKEKQLKQDIDNFQFMELKVKQTFDEKEPVLSDEKKSLLDAIDKKIESIKENQQVLENKITYEKKLLKKYNHKLKSDCDLFENKLKDIIETNTDNVGKILLNIISEKERIRDTINSDINSLINETETRYNEIVKKELEFIVESNKTKEKINENIKLIEEGVCPTCKRPFSDDYELHKQKIIEENRYLESKMKDCIDKSSKLAKIKTQLADELTSYKSSLDEFVFANDVKDLSRFINRELFKDYNTDITNIVELYNKSTEIQTKTKEFEKLLKYVNMFSSIVASNGINIDNCKDIKDNYQNSLNKTIKESFEKLESSLISINEFENTMNEYEDHIEKLQNKVKEVNDDLNRQKSLYFENLKKVEENNKLIDNQNEIIREHNKKKDLMIRELEIVSEEQKDLITKLPLFNEILEIKEKQESDLQTIKQLISQINEEITKVTLDISNNENILKKYEQMYDDYIKYQKNQIVWKIYNKLIKNGFRDIVFEYYRCFLNNTLNNLLEDVNFKLYWDANNQLYMIDASNGVVSYQPVINSSGMETSFLGLSLIYTIHLLNVKNSISHIFIDELSGTLSRGDKLTYEAKDYQDLFIKILNKFNEKTIFIVDHNIDNLFETLTYEVYRNISEKTSKFRIL